MPSRGCPGFSLLELLLVLALLGILTGIASFQLAPLLQRVGEGGLAHIFGAYQDESHG